MSYILCKTKKTDVPFYIENISTNIYSIEELCFYLYHNMYLLDETILGEKLCFWLRDELGLAQLSRRLLQLMDQEPGIGDLVLPVFKEIGYLSHEEFRIYAAKLAQFESQPKITRMKLRADYLFTNEKFMNALKMYEACLKLQTEESTGQQFLGSIYHNMGCAHARLLQLGEARYCFEKANQLLHSRATLLAYLTAVYLDEGREKMEKQASRMGIDEKLYAELKAQIAETKGSLAETPESKRYHKLEKLQAEGREDEYQKGMDNFLRELTDAYHRNTGF